MEGARRPGPKPKRLYGRLVRLGDLDRTDLPLPRALRSFVENLDRVGRLVAQGRLTDPPGDLLILRAVDLPEAKRILRVDPYRELEGTGYDVFEWDPTDVGSGVNLEPPPALGSGRLTFLQRVAVVVRDQRKAMAWYRDVLGLTIRVHDPETGYVELALGRGAAGLCLIEPRAEWGEPYYSEAMGRIGSATGVAFQTDSVLALEQRLRRADASVSEGPASQPWGGAALRFNDPDGNGFLAFQETADARIPLARRPSPAASPPVRWARGSPRPKRL